MVARGHEEKRKETKQKKKKQKSLSSLVDTLFLHRIPEGYNNNKKKEEVVLEGGWNRNNSNRRRMSMMMPYSFFGNYKRVPVHDDEPPEPAPVGLLGGLMVAAGSLSRQQLMTLLAALPIVLYVLYPLIQTFLKRQRKRKHKRRRSHSDYWYDDQSERMLLSVHINERPRNKKKSSSSSRRGGSGSRRQQQQQPMNDDSRNSVMSNSSNYSINRRQIMLRQKQMERFTEWGLSVRQLDPRLQIYEFFTEVAAVGASNKLERCKIHITGGCTHNCLGRIDPNKANKKNGGKKILSLLPSPVTRLSYGKKTPAMTVSQFLLADQCFDQASVFTVWRPTSDDAIRKMIRGEAVGKGLDIKGKSATKGKLSALVPVLQIHDNKHKPMLRHVPKDAVMRVYYQTQRGRNIAKIQLEKILKEMVKGFKEAARVVKTQNLLEQMLGERAQQLPGKFWKESLNRKYKWEMDNPIITNLNHIGPGRFGLEMPQRLFVEAYIFRGDCHREPNSPNDTGRSSIPSFQDMNLETLRKYKPPKKSSSSSSKKDQMVIPPRPVAFQFNTDPMQAMDPKDLVMAYEENDRVLPVVSDFDCFLVGTRRVNYRHPLPEKQVQMMSWCVDNIEKVLDDKSSSSWTGSWLEILKQERVKNGFKPEIPKYGYADPKSYAIMGHAIHHLQVNGSVRHGAECFNYYFPQDLDEQFLVVSYDIRNGGNRWRRFQRHDLLQFLSQKVDEGFMFPLNPKWILCDPGWKVLYDKQLQSKSSSVRQSMNAWYPQSSGIRERIEDIHKRHSNGFVIKQPSIRRLGTTVVPVGEMSMDQALMELEHVDKLQKAKRVVQAVIAVNRMRKALANAKSAETKGIRGASLGRGSLPQKKQVIRVKVPKTAIPLRLQQQVPSAAAPLKRSNSFTIRSLTEAVPIFRSLSFDFGVSPWGKSSSSSSGGGVRNSITALFSEDKVGDNDAFPPPMEQASSLNSSEAHSLPIGQSPTSQPLEQKPPTTRNSQQPSEQRPASRNSWDGGANPHSASRPVPVRNVRRHRSERFSMNAAVDAAAKERNNPSNNTTNNRYP